MTALSRCVCDARMLENTFYAGGGATAGGLFGEEEYAH